MVKYISLDTSCYQEETSTPDPDDRWDRASTSTSWEVHGLILSDKDGYKSLPVKDVKVGDVLYAVYAIYSTGDSFGSDDGAELELVSLHKTKAIAEENVAAIKNYKRNSTYIYTIKLDNGEMLERYCPWDGYFESLDSIQCKGFVVT